MTKAAGSWTEGEVVAGGFKLLGPVPDRGLGEALRAHEVGAPSTERLVKLYALAPSAVAAATGAVERLRAQSVPGVAAVVGGGVWRDRLVVAYEGCAGRSLHDWIAGWRSTRTPPPAPVLKSIFSALCSVVDAAHQQGLHHERLSPRSVIITSIRAAKPMVVLDAGLAGCLSGDDLAACHDYLNADVLDRARKGADPRRADLFSLGVILAELLTLRPRPHAEGRETWEQLARAAAKRPNAPFPARPDDAPAALWALVERLLMRRDAELASAVKVRAAARAAWEAAGVKDATPDALRDAPTPVEERVERPSREEPRSSAPSTSAPSPEPAAPPQRAVVHSAYSVPVAPARAEAAAPVSPTPPATPRPSSPEPPAVARVASSPPAPPAPVARSVPAAQATLVDAAPSFAGPDAGADTLSDLDDPGATAPQARPSRPSAGGDTLALDDGEHGFARAAPAPPDATLLLEAEPPTSVLPARARQSQPRAVESSDPFAQVRRAGGDTLPIDDARSPLADRRPIAPQSPLAAPASPLTLGPGIRSPVAASPIQPLPQAGGDTLPLDGAALVAVGRPIAPVVPFVPAAPSLPPARPAPSPADQTSQLPVVDGDLETRTFYTKLAAGVVLGGLILGGLLTALLASVRH